MNKPLREAHYACENGACSEECLYPHTMLNEYEGRLWCEECWEEENPLMMEGESEVDWSDLDSFVPAQTIDCFTVTRFEVIDHTETGSGRDFVKYGANVELAFQDDGHTLKVFLKDS